MTVRDTINGASLTIAEANREDGWFEVWLIPETRRTTVFEEKRVGDFVNVEIERGTQIVVDTVRDAVAENLGKLKPLLEAFLQEKGISPDELVSPPRLRLKEGHEWQEGAKAYRDFIYPFAAKNAHQTEREYQKLRAQLCQCPKK